MITSLNVILVNLPKSSCLRLCRMKIIQMRSSVSMTILPLVLCMLLSSLDTRFLMMSASADLLMESVLLLVIRCSLQWISVVSRLVARLQLFCLIRWKV